MNNYRRPVAQRSIATKSKSSPTNQSRACMCPDSTYHKVCCNGDLQAQGIGSLTGGSKKG